jgi:deoxyribonuclease V
MSIKNLHSWNLSYTQAVELQKRFASEVRFTPLKKSPRLTAGIDCALSKDGQKIIAAVVVLKIKTAGQNLWEPSETPGFEIVETTSAIRQLSFPYIPGLLSFREAPVCIAAVEKLNLEPDAFIVDGQGIAHPRRLGLAAHLGLFLDRPMIGCAKSRLVGVFEEPAGRKGAYSLLKDHDEVIGAVVRTRTNVKPVFVSVGHRCSLEDAVKTVLKCTTKYRLPEPTRLAHQTVGKVKQDHEETREY